MPLATGESCCVEQQTTHVEVFAKKHEQVDNAPCGNVQRVAVPV